MTTVRSLNLAALILMAIISCQALPVQDKISHDLNDVHFLLYTRDQPVSSPIEIPFNFSSLQGTGFDPTRPRTVFLMHGFTAGQTFAEDFVPDLLIKEDMNIISIVWHELATWENYVAAAQNAMAVGEHAGNFLIRIYEETSLDLATVHAVGHSLGAQGSGHLGRTVRDSTSNKIGRITGLDPAKPYFDLISLNQRLNKNDAAFVDVIHTNSGSLTHGCLSFMDDLGHVDFYPAGGSHQPGCAEVCALGCAESDLIDLMKGGCSHGRANEYFIESINTRVGFSSKLCASWEDFTNNVCHSSPWVKMGFNLDPNSVAHGKYYLNVRNQSPYALGG